MHCQGTEEREDLRDAGYDRADHRSDIERRLGWIDHDGIDDEDEDNNQDDPFYRGHRLLSRGPVADAISLAPEVAWRKPLRAKHDQRRRSAVRSGPEYP
jgi:hypothetical protein